MPVTITINRVDNEGSLIVEGFAFGGFSGRETALRVGSELDVTTENVVNALRKLFSGRGFFGGNVEVRTAPTFN